MNRIQFLKKFNAQYRWLRRNNIELLNRILPSKNKNNVEANKAELRKLAASGAPRPPKSTPLGRALESYTIPSSNSYNSDYLIEMKGLTPKWFENKNNVEANKAAILAIAASGGPRPPFSTPLSRALSQYTTPSGSSYDSDFTAELRKLVPHWFRQQKAAA